jgi:hypothetical protein
MAQASNGLGDPVHCIVGATCLGWVKAACWENDSKFTGSQNR